MDRISMQVVYDELRRYARILADKEHKTTEGMFIRFTTYEFEGLYYVVTKVNGDVFMIANKDDVRELICDED